MSIQPKQIAKVQAGLIGISGISATGGSTNITTALSTALSTAGAGGASVPVQPSTSEGLGLIVSGTTNRVEINESNLKDTNGREIYGRLTHASGVYTLTYFTFDGTTETPYSFPSSTNIVIDIPYRFDFARLPVDSAISTSYRVINVTTSQAGQKTYTEQLTATGTNSVLTLSKTPDVAANVRLHVWGVAYTSPFYFAVNTSARTVTWNSANAGFDIVPADRLFVVYTSLE